MRSERAPVALCLIVLLAVAGCSSAGSSASTASSAPAATAAATTAPSVAAATTAPTPAPSEIPAADVTGDADRARLGRLRPGHLLGRLQERPTRRRPWPSRSAERRRRLLEDEGGRPGRRLPPVHRLAPVLRRRRPRRRDRHVAAQELEQGARGVQEDRPDQRQAVLRPVGLGLHLDPLPDRQDQDADRHVGRAARSDVQGTHLDVGRRPGSGHRVVLHPRLRRDRHHGRPARGRSRPSGSRSATSTRSTGVGRDRPRRGDDIGRRLGSPTPGRARTRRSWPMACRSPTPSPKEGRNSWVGVYGIRKDSPNYDLALRFLDEKLGERHRQQPRRRTTTTARPTAT